MPRKRKPKGAKRIGEILPQLMARRGYAEHQQSNVLEQAWHTAAGGTFAKHTRVVRIRGEVMEVVVRNSTILQELTFRKAQIVRVLASELSGNKVSDLKFRIGQFG